MIGYGLSENFTSAVGIATEEFSQMKPKGHGFSTDGQVSQGALVEAMDFVSGHLAGGAAPNGLSGHQANVAICFSHVMLGELKLVGQNGR